MLNKIITSLIPLLCIYNVSSQNNIDKFGFNRAVKDFQMKETLVILGEAHEVAGTYILESFIVEEFAKKGYTTLIIEGGNSEAIILNEYLRTGNESILEYTRARGGDYRRLLTKIKTLININLNLEIIGVDFERARCLEYLFSIWFNNITNPKLKAVISSLQSINSKTSPKKIKKIILKVKKDYGKYEIAFKKELGKNSEQLFKIIHNPCFEADYGMSSRKRDKSILQNLMNINTEKLKKSILIFGSNHFTHKKHFWPAFANSKASEIECLLILFSYKNCTNFTQNNKYNSTEPLSIYVENDDPEKCKISFELVKNTKLSLSEKENRMIIVKLINQ